MKRRLALLVAAAAGLVLTAVDAHGLWTARQRVRAELMDAGYAGDPAVVDRILRADRGWAARVRPADDPLNQVTRLAGEMAGDDQPYEAERLAAGVLRSRPVSSQAWQVWGLAREAVADDPVAEMGLWRPLLERAIRLAPGRHEPRRALAAALIDAWPELPAAERESATLDIAAAFEHSGTRRALLPDWLTAAGDRDRAFAAIPDVAPAWHDVMQVMRDEGEWTGYAAAWERRTAALRRDLPVELDALQRRIGLGDVASARGELLNLVASTPPDRRFAEQIARALALLPPGVASSKTTRAFSDWLQWALDGEIHGVSLLPPSAIGRLAAGVEDLAAPEAALAALAAEGLEQADRKMRGHEDLGAERWGGFMLARARALVAAGRANDARGTLTRMHPSWRDNPLAEVLEATLRRRTVTDIVRSLWATSWPVTAWRRQSGTASLDLIPAPGTGLLELEIDLAPQEGAVAEVSVDFEAAWVGQVRPGDVIQIPVPEPGTPHLVQIRGIAGGTVDPGGAKIDRKIED